MLAFIRKLFTQKKGNASNSEDAAPAQAQDGNSPEETLPQTPLAPKSWLALGLDGALASTTPHGLRGPIGAPVYNTVQRLKDWTEHRKLTVKILTPRAATEEGANAVRAWLKEHNLPELEVTHAKDLQMVEFWSAHCVQVISNTGQIVGPSSAKLDQQAKKAEELPAQADATTTDAS